MIKITKYIYINIITVILFVFCYINRKIDIFFITYSIMTIHELAHLCAALFIGLKPSYIAFHPFGVNLKLANKIISCLSDEIILYSAGPFANIVMSLICIIFFYNTSWGRLLYTGNITLFIMNMMPVVPLDGGIILKKILTYKLGTKKAKLIVRVFSIFFILIFFSIGIYAVYITKYNYSVLFLSILLAGNLFTQKEKYNSDFIKELMLYNQRKQRPIQHAQILVANENLPPREIAKHFRGGKYSIVCITNNDGDIKTIETQTTTMNKLFNTNKNTSDITF